MLNNELPTEDADKQERGLRPWLRHNKFKLALGAMATSVVASLITTPGGDTIRKLVEVAPWAIPSAAGSEAAWIGGMALMAAGAGSKIGNPFKLHDRGDEIMGKVNDSRTFKAGFWINAAGAVGTAGVAGAAVVSGLPPEGWGVLAVPVVDLAATLGARKVILDELHTHSMLPEIAGGQHDE